MHLKVRLLAFALLILSPLISDAVEGTGDEKGNWYYSKESLSTEVFLNREGISVNTTILDERIKEGTAIKRNDSYIFRMETNDDLFVIIDHEEGNGTDLIPYEDTGYSITFGIFSERESRTVKTDLLVIDLENENGFRPAISQLMLQNGFRLKQYEDIVIFEREKIVLEYHLVEGFIQYMTIQWPEGESGVEDGLILNILEFMEGEPVPDITPYIGESSSHQEEVLVYIPVIDPSVIDWSELIDDELEIMVNSGLINGLNLTDICSISRNASIGLSGNANRIIEFKGILGNEEGRWVSYLSTPFPLEFDQGENDNITITSSDVPRTPEDNGVEQIPYVMIMGLVMTVFLILVTLIILYLRVRTGALMKNAYRKKIVEIIRENPGIHFREIMREIGIKQGVLSYHLNKLEKADLIKSKQDGMHRRFFLFNSNAEIGINLSDLQKELMILILNNPGIAQSELSRDTGRNQALIHYHIRFLKDAGLIWVEKERGKTMLFISNVGSGAI